MIKSAEVRSSELESEFVVFPYIFLVLAIPGARRNESQDSWPGYCGYWLRVTSSRAGREG
jgi:hypothetical protein